tara:strand:+ start:1385 stop:1642 length:258 start_codon:yes stop_codon:yes gene_type:complete
MPTYTFESNKTGKIWDDTMSWKKLEEYYKEHDCVQIFTSMPKVVSMVGDVQSKTTSEFKDKMADIHKQAGKHSQMFKGTKEQGNH